MKTFSKFIRKNWKLLDYILIQKTMVDEDVSNACILDDPMNGCPGDFAEDFARQSRRIEAQAARVQPTNRIVLAVLDQIFAWYHKHRMNQWYFSQPWNSN